MWSGDVGCGNIEEMEISLTPSDSIRYLLGGDGYVPYLDDSVSWMYTYVQTYITVYLKYMKVIIYQSYPKELLKLTKN